MANVNVKCRNFEAPYAGKNGTYVRNITRRAILRAIITIGAQRFFDVFTLGWRGLAHRFGIGLSAFSFLEESTAGLCIADQYNALDMSEKSVSTYWYGMAFAKLIADSELGVPWLAHVDQMRKSGVLITSSSTNERGDLVGRGQNNDWHVIEAKARSNSYQESLVSKAKGQSAGVTAINYRPPATTSACITSLFTQPISILFDDPPPDIHKNGEEWKIKDEEYFRHYYKGIKEYLGESTAHKDQEVGDAVFLTAPLPPFFWNFFHSSPSSNFTEYQLEVGLLSSIYESPEKAPEALKNLKHDDKGIVGSDGIAIFGSMPE